ncbi:MAG: hypothetical protein E7A11_13720 [Clostridium sp.]|uniref:hypothetical protein n=1 Tax=Clostridium sp. TaxID=1506 RepID=UPI0029013F1B|nr:hypothetical protein [Clostridium sp.]MDU1096403.1 hypothetical protein [Clostridioides difficile]MDU1075698.1 hypothetical protein [Clostridium sp.]MDU1126333.1 hypothetical protein [Clostridium sp.]MDU3677231.1 hypothetical protein [Clostridium sp.]MDU4726354.1 hypothetical protein [Clostridium sp.]
MDNLFKELNRDDKKKAELIELILIYATEQKMSGVELVECLDIVKTFALLKSK